MEVDEIWAYRPTGKHPLEPVRFLKHRRGTGPKSKYSLIRFEDPEADGREEWVPDGRLKCPWDEVAEFQANEHRWAAILAASREREGVFLAVNEVLTALLPQEIWDNASGPGTGHTDEGAYSFANLEELARLTGISVEELCGAPTTFEQDGRWIVPLATGRAVAEKLAALDPATILLQVERAERDLAEDESDYRLRYSIGHRQTEDWWEERRHSTALRRKWIGEENISLRDEAFKAQQESERLRGLVEWAIRKLDHYGHGPSSATLQKYLDGAPLPTYKRRLVREESAESPQSPKI